MVPDMNIRPINSQLYNYPLSTRVSLAGISVMPVGAITAVEVVSRDDANPLLDLPLYTRSGKTVNFPGTVGENLKGRLAIYA